MAKKNTLEIPTALTLEGALELSTPRDRHGRFAPALFRKHCRRFPGFDDKVLALYAYGMSPCDIQRHVREIYGIDISPDLVLTVTDSIIGEVTAWQARTLESSYAIVFFDALQVKIRDEGLVENKTAHLAIGIRPCGHKEVLGLWIEQSEDATFWMRVMSDLRDRGTQDILIAVVEGSKGFQDAIAAVFPNTVVQACIVHLIRYSLQFASWHERGRIARALRHIYHANSATGAAVALAYFDLDVWGRKYPAIAERWRRDWEAIIPFFALPAEVRRIIYTTNAIESLNACVRRAVRNKEDFPNDQAAIKLIWLALRNVAENWKNPPRWWRGAKAQLAIRFKGRFVLGE